MNYIRGSAVWAVESTIFAAQVTSLAGILLGGIARRRLAAVVRVLVSTSPGAVAVSGHWLRVDVVHYDRVSKLQRNLNSRTY